MYADFHAVKLLDSGQELNRFKNLSQNFTD